MSIFQVGPRAPILTYMRHDYEPLLGVIAAAKGEWVTVPMDLVAGRSPQAKRQTLHAAALYRGLKLRTSIKDGLAAALFTEPVPPPVAILEPAHTPGPVPGESDILAVWDSA